MIVINKEWSELNKTMQLQLRNKNTYQEGRETLMRLRKELIDEICLMKKDLSREDFNAIPFINAKGYHSKTIAYSLWHIFRIEDIVAHTLIMDDEQILFKGNYQEKIGTAIITTGNELVKEQIADFSKTLNMDELYNYIAEVMNSTNELLKKLAYQDLKQKVSDEYKEKLRKLNVVSENENAYWLIDYWCNKDVKGLIQMPFSRHWIMHIEACERIIQKINKNN